MIKIEIEYRGSKINLESESAKSDMTDAIAAVDYVHTRTLAGTYSGKGETQEKKPTEATPDEEAPEQEPEEEKPTPRERKSRAKPKPEVEEKEVVEEEVAEEEDLPWDDGEEDAPDKVTDEELRDAVMAYVDKNGSVKGKALIAQFGGARLSEVPEDKRSGLWATAIAGSK